MINSNENARVMNDSRRSSEIFPPTLMFNPLIFRIQKKCMYTPLLFIIDEYKNNSLFEKSTQENVPFMILFLL